MIPVQVEFLKAAIERAITEFMEFSNVDLDIEVKLKEECKRFVEEILQILALSPPPLASPCPSPTAVPGVSPIKIEVEEPVSPNARADESSGSELEDAEVMLGWKFSDTDDDEEDKKIEDPLSPTTTDLERSPDNRDSENETSNQSASSSSSSSSQSSSSSSDSSSDSDSDENVEPASKSSPASKAKLKSSSSVSPPPQIKPDKPPCRYYDKPHGRKRIRFRKKPEYRQHCDECPRKFHYPFELGDHKALHANPNAFQCQTCQAALTSSSGLRHHMRAIHTEDQTQRKRFLCNICGAKYLSRAHLLIHQKVKHNDGKREFICEICGKAEPHPRYLARHIKVNHPDKERLKNFECEQCGKKFVTKPVLKAHMNVHSEEKAFSCEKCGQMFKYLSTLTRHQRLQRKNCRPQIPN